jgi:hypothetical protein
MSTSDTQLTSEELGWELVEVFDALKTDEINEMLAKNVPLDTLRFFAGYAEQVGEAESIDVDARKRLPNLLLLGYLLRLLEERLIPDDDLGTP